MDCRGVRVALCCTRQPVQQADIWGLTPEEMCCAPAGDRLCQLMQRFPAGSMVMHAGAPPRRMCSLSCNARAPTRHKLS